MTKTSTVGKFYKADIIACVNIMKTCKSGGVVSFETLSSACGRRIDMSAAKHIIREARIELQTTYGMLFKPTKDKIGLRRMIDDEIVRDSYNSVSRIERAANRAIEGLKCVKDYDVLSESNKLKFNTSSMITRVIGRVSSIPAVSSLEDNFVKTGMSKITTDDAIKFFLTL